MIWLVVICAELIMSGVVISRVSTLNRNYVEYNYRYEPDVLAKSVPFYYFPGWLFLFILILAPLILSIMNPELWKRIEFRSRTLWREGLQEWRAWRKE